MRRRSLFNLFIVLGFYITFILFIKSKFPNTQELIEVTKNIYLTNGYILIFFAALLEAMFVVGFFIPGSTIVILGAAFAKTGVVYYPLVFLVGTSGLVLGYLINYFMGKYGWYHVLNRLGFEKGIEKAKNKILLDGTRTIFLGYFYPNSAAFISTAAGTLSMPIKKFLFLSILAQSFWSLLWGTLAYLYGLSFVEFILKYFIAILLLILLIWFLRRVIKSKINPSEF